MDYVDGLPLIKMGDHITTLSPTMQRLASERIMGRIADAYGCMLLSGRRFQADCHPGNILVLKKGNIGLIDFGQAKELDAEQTVAFAKMIKALAIDAKYAGKVSRGMKKGEGKVTNGRKGASTDTVDAMGRSRDDKRSSETNVAKDVHATARAAREMGVDFRRVDGKRIEKKEKGEEGSEERKGQRREQDRGREKGVEGSVTAKEKEEGKGKGKGTEGDQDVTGDAVVARMARDMFDTRGTLDPFGPDSPLKTVRGQGVGDGVAGLLSSWVYEVTGCGLGQR